LLFLKRKRERVCVRPIYIYVSDSMIQSSLLATIAPTLSHYNFASLNLVPPCVTTALSISPPSTIAIAAASVVYLLSANIFYLARRAHLRNETMHTMLRYRLDREPGVSIPRYCSFILAWQAVVIIFPILEPIAKIFFQCCSLFYSYPNAHGFGLILEPLACQHLPLNQRAKQQVRLDWHRFSVNVGKVGRNGYRHPPVQEMNRPHVDAPKWQIKHWPWRRQRRYYTYGAASNSSNSSSSSSRNDGA
jgi:hypothetical protein